MSRRQSHMRPSIRQAEICDLVAKKGEVSVDILAKKFDTSAETIRRDLTALADAGRLRKVHGGARSMAVQGEGQFDQRMRLNALAKRQIAEKLTTLITPHQTLFMDTGSTTLICAEALARIKNLTIITNSTRIAETFAAGRGGAEIYLLGGRFSGANNQTVGEAVIEQIASYRADMAVITVGAIDQGAVMDFSNQEAQVARAMIDAAKQVTIVADHTKFEQTASFKVCDLDGIDRAVFDKLPDRELREAFSIAEVDILT